MVLIMKGLSHFNPNQNRLNQDFLKIENLISAIETDLKQNGQPITDLATGKPKLNKYH
tara:strand:- start:440 stop:613 length:174 start_codon:yes stop_codon:yes gene_type:complete